MGASASLCGCSVGGSSIESGGRGACWEFLSTFEECEGDVCGNPVLCTAVECDRLGHGGIWSATAVSLRGLTKRGLHA